MIDYKYLYLGTVALFIFPIAIYLIENYRKLSTTRYSFAIVSLLSISCIYIFVNREIIPVTDTEAYISMLHICKSDIALGKPFVLFTDTAWAYFTLACAYLDLSDRAFLCVCALLFILPIIGAFYRMFSKNMLLPLYLLFCCFFFLSLGTNVLRSGIGFSFFILAISYKDNIKLIILFCVIAVLFHLSFILSVFLFFFFYFFKIDIKYVIIAWFIMLIVSFLNISTLNTIASLVNSSDLDSRMSSYLTSTSSGYRVGFRPDFVLFSFFFGGIGVFLQKKVYSDGFYDRILKIYIASNAFFLLTMNIHYSDRFAILSWILIPVICSYPLIEANYKNWRVMISVLSLIMLSLTYVLNFAI